jgi:hypothetical protein
VRAVKVTAITSEALGGLPGIAQRDLYDHVAADGRFGGWPPHWSIRTFDSAPSRPSRFADGLFAVVRVRSTVRCGELPCGNASTDQQSFLAERVDGQAFWDARSSATPSTEAILCRNSLRAQ